MLKKIHAIKERIHRALYNAGKRRVYSMAYGGPRPGFWGRVCVHYYARVLGVDVVRLGDDRTVMSLRQVLHKRDTMQVVGAVCATLKEHAEAGHPIDGVFVDVIGIGAGVVDRLKQLMETDEYQELGYDPDRIIAVNGSRKQRP